MAEQRSTRRDGPEAADGRPPAGRPDPADSRLPAEQPDPAEPAGAQDAAAEAEHDEAAQRPAGLEGAEPEEDAERERDEYLELAQRTQADFENYRKRAAREAATAGERAKAGLVRELLSVVDNLERALASATDDEQHLADGVRLVHAELLGVLQRSGVEGYDPTGEPFDPERHEALSTRPQEGAGSGLVLDVAEKGYTLNGSVLRPARVVVSA